MVQLKKNIYVQEIIEMRGQILTTRYWLHAQLGKNILKILSQNILSQKIAVSLLRCPTTS
jgi:hypothetical protein